MTDLLSKLDAYYRKQRIHPLDFRCPHAPDCASGCDNFTEARASLVATNYGDPIRVVVLSLDPGNSAKHGNAEGRTSKALQRRHAATDVAKLHKGHHWYKTHETVAALLSHFGAPMEAADAGPRFAHVNAAKCCHNLPGNKQAPAHLFENCRRHLESELALLRPDVVITQGDRAAAVIEPWRVPLKRKPIARADGHEFYWLRLVHPTAWGGAYGKERKEWGPLFESAAKWVESRLSSSSTACVFCSPPRERRFHNSKLVRGIWDAYPVSRGHALLFPKRHVETWREATTAERRALADAVSRVQGTIQKRYAPDGFNVGMNIGEAAGQTVSHLHVHVIPRYEGDAADPRGGVRWVLPEHADYWSGN